MLVMNRMIRVNWRITAQNGQRSQKEMEPLAMVEKKAGRRVRQGGPQDKESLKNIAKALEKYSSQIESLIAELDAYEIDVVNIKHTAEIDRALTYLPKFVREGEEAIQEMRKKKGHFRAAEKQPEQAPNGTSGKKQSKPGKAK
jgi:hypothetical protein